MRGTWCPFRQLRKRARTRGKWASNSITFSPARLEHIRAVSDVPVAMVGPYIAYAPDYLDEIEMEKARDELGKTLLVFLAIRWIE